MIIEWSKHLRERQREPRPGNGDVYVVLPGWRSRSLITPLGWDGLGSNEVWGRLAAEPGPVVLPMSVARHHVVIWIATKAVPFVPKELKF